MILFVVQKPEMEKQPEDEVVDKLASMDVDTDDPALLKHRLAHQHTVVASINGEAWRLLSGGHLYSIGHA